MSTTSAGRSLLGALLLASAFFGGCASAERGRKIYAREQCGHCHRFGGEGGSLAPDLTAVTARRSDEWIKRQILSPEKNDARSRMPPFGHLSGREVRSLLAYLKS